MIPLRELQWACLEHMTREQRGEFMSRTVTQSIAAQVRSLRQSRGLSLKQMGERCGLSWQTIWRLERATKNASTTLDTLLKIATGMNVALIVKFVGWPEWLRRYFSLEVLGLPTPIDEEELVITPSGILTNRPHPGAPRP